LATGAVAQEVQRIAPKSNPPVHNVVPEGNTIISQPPNQSNGLFADMGCDGCASGQQSIADNLLVPVEGFVANTITFWGGYFPGNMPLAVDDIDVIFHSDAGGLPGAAICTYTGVVPTSRTDTGVDLFGVDEFLFVLDFDPCVLPGGATVWVELFNNTGVDGQSFFWEAGDLDPTNGFLNNAFATATPGVAWLVGNPVTDVAFQVGGSVVPVELQTINVE
jgi:hypothetical protein